MKRVLTIVLRRSARSRALLFLLLSLASLALPRTAAAQTQNLEIDSTTDVSDLCDFGFVCELDSVTIIYDTTSPTHLDVLTETDVNLDALDDGFGAFNCATVLQDGGILDDGCAADDGSGKASVAGSVTIDTTHGTSVFTLVNDSYFADFLFDPTACDDGDPTFCTLVSEDGIDVAIGPISITSTSPSALNVGTTGTMTINGENLVNPFGGQPDVQVQFRGGNGTGLNVSQPNFSPDGSQGTVFYQVAQNATVGSWNLGIDYVMGDALRTSTNEGNLIVGYPAAIVSNVTPNPWQAGQSNFTVTITGQNFGPSPTLTITGVGVSLNNYTPNANGQSIQANVSVAPNAPNQNNVTVDVRPGYNGSFVCTCTGSPDGTSTVTVQAVTPTPQIIFNGTNISGTTQNVFAGQQIALSVPTPPGYNILSQSWAINGARTGGFTNTAGTGPPSNTAGGKKQGDPTLNQSSLTFYWMHPGDLGNTVTYTYTLDNAQSASATATFNILGPVDLPTVTVAPNGSGVKVVRNAKIQILGVPYQNGQVGATFTTAANQPTGAGTYASFMWLQLIANLGTTVINSNGQVPLPINPSSGLDGTYPYFSGTPTGTYDSPSSNLPSIYGELYRTFDATMYSLWDPALPSGCRPATTSTDGCFTQTPSNCTSIPIPLGSVRWRWNGCAINTLIGPLDSPTWNLSCGFSQTYAAQASDYPQWTATISVDIPNTCH